MEKDVEKIISERIKKNEKMFSNKEIKVINGNLSTICKIYTLGLVDKK